MDSVIRRLYLTHYGWWWVDLKEYFDVLKFDRSIDRFIDKYKTFKVRDE